MRFSLLLPAALLSVCAALVAGCTTLGHDPEWQGSPHVQLANARSQPIPAATRRVLAFPLDVPQIAGTAQRDLDVIFAQELNKHQRFEVVRLSRGDLSNLIGKEEVSSTETFPAEALNTLRQRHAPDAILFTDITSYRPYRPMAIGVRARLLDAQTLRELWSIDTTLDAAHAEVERAALQSRPEGPSRAGLVLQSPRAFATFVAQQVFATLPPR